MGKNTVAGIKAYKEKLNETGSKDEAKLAQKKANELYWKNQFNLNTKNSVNINLEIYDFNHSINNGKWHISDDL